MREQHSNPALMQDRNTQQEPLRLCVPSNQSAAAFLDYLKAYHLTALDVAMISRVRYLQVWKIGQGYPVTEAHAASVRAGLHQLTGVPYRATIAVLSHAEGKKAAHLTTALPSGLSRSLSPDDLA